MGSVLYAYFCQFKRWHEQLDRFSWLTPYLRLDKPISTFILTLCVLAGLCSVWMNVGVRSEQYAKWAENPEIFALQDGTPLYTTTDAPYFIGKAQTLKSQGSFQAFNERRVFPVNRDAFLKEPPPDSIFDTELLVVLLAWLSDNASPKALLETGHFLIPITAGLTAIMVMLAFGAGGYWIEGGIAGAGSGLSFATLVRTGAGRIDTDQLNVGLFYLLIAAVIFASRSKNFRHAIWLTSAACLCSQLFLWWYAKALFAWMAAAGLVWLSLYQHENIKRSLIQVICFVILGGAALNSFGLGDAYLRDTFQTGEFIFPNTFDTITEISKRDWPAIAQSMTGSVSLSIFGTIGYVLFCLRHPHIGGVYAPALLFVFASFIAGNRMIFYAVPVIWFGVGWLSITLIRGVFSAWKNQLSQRVAIACGATGCFTLVWVQSPTDLLQRPSFPAPIVQALASPVLQGNPDAVLASWWDYGYSALLFNDGYVFHDGGSQNGPRTHYIARGLLSSSQAELAAILKFIADDGERYVFTDGNDFNIIEQKISQTGTQQAVAPIYLFLTSQMSQWMPSIGKLGAYDIAKGKALLPPAVLGRRMHGYLSLNCSPTGQQYRLQCGNNMLQLNTGELDNKQAFSALVQADAGKMGWAKQFDENIVRPILFIDQIANARPKISAIAPQIYFSNHHQMFHLGQVDERYFEMVEDNYPHSRTFKLK